VYNLLGAGDEQLAIYHGQQTRDSLCSEGGRRVYLYPAEYHTRGPNDLTNVITRPTGEKQYVVGDHLGSARSVYSSYGSIFGQYDYTPFGEKSGGSTPHNSYIDRERDGESSLLDFGVRKFDPTTGRFLTVDPLMTAYPGQSPYSYSFNNPLSYKDPSGFEMMPVYIPADHTNNNPLNYSVGHYEDRNVVPRSYWYSQGGVGGSAGIITVPGVYNGGGGGD
jgi:RHS repeat-associated protein